MKMKSPLLGATIACLAFAFSGASAMGGDMPYAAWDPAKSSSPETMGIPQPHLAKARALAFPYDSWQYLDLINCYPQDKKPLHSAIIIPPPTKTFDNVYYVGIGWVASWAIKTSAGIIIIDTLNNADEAKTYIVGGLKKLGLDPNDIKYVIVTHGHEDHYGGAKYLQDTIPGVHVYMSAPDYDYADKQAVKSKALSGIDVPPPRHDLVITDGEKLTLGDETITFYVTPGHTPATLSMLIPVKDHGVPRLMSFWGGTASNGLSPENHKLYDSSMTRFENISAAAKVDGYFNNHPGNDGSDIKIEQIRQNPNGPNPYLVGTAKTVISYKVTQECNLNEADVQAWKMKHGK